MFEQITTYRITDGLDYEDRAAVKAAIEEIVRKYEQVRKCYRTLQRAVDSERRDYD